MRCCQQKSRRSQLADIIISGTLGWVLLLLGAVALLQIIRGEFTVTAHFCQRYGIHFTSTAMFFLMVGAILGPALVWRAWFLMRKRQRHHHDSVA